MYNIQRVEVLKVRSLITPLRWNIRRNKALYQPDINFTSHKCQRSWAAAKYAKYGADSKVLT